MSIKVKDLISTLPGIELLPDDTVDGYICGSPETLLTGVAVTFLATLEHCYNARQNNCNLIISHEGIWYHHREQHIDAISHAKDDPIYLEKQAFLQENKITLYRYHDGIHRTLPDRITRGIILSLHWTAYEITQEPAYSILELNTKLIDIIRHIKNTLGLSYLRYIGAEDTNIKKALIAVGYRGNGSMILPILQREQVDLVIYGEGPEWEIPEYCRDAQTLNLDRSLIILGHGTSESPGMELLANELTTQFRDIPIHYLPFTNQLLLY